MRKDGDAVEDWCCIEPRESFLDCAGSFSTSVVFVIVGGLAGCCFFGTTCNRDLLLKLLLWEVGTSLSITMYSLISALGTVSEMTRGTGLRSETRRGEPKSLPMLSEDLPSEIFGRLSERS